MTVFEIAKKFDLQPRDVAAFIQANATFPVKRNFQTGELSIPDNVDIAAFIMPMLDQEHKDKLVEEKRAAEAKIQEEIHARQEAEQQYSIAVEALKKWAQKVITSIRSSAL